MINRRFGPYIYLLIGFFFLFFANGRWILPAAAFLAPLFLIRFLRTQSPFKGFLLIVLASCISNIFIWKGMNPMTGFIYYLVMFMMSLFTAIPFLLDRIIMQKIKGVISSLVFPSAYVLLEYIVVSTNPSGSYGTMGHTQDYLPLMQIVSITGIWGIVFIVTWTSSIFNWLWDKGYDIKSLKKALPLYFVPLMLMILLGQVRLMMECPGDTVKIGAINISAPEAQHIYNARPVAANDKINQIFLDNCQIASHARAKIVFGIESMLNMTDIKEPAFIDKAKAVAQRANIYIGLPLLIYSTDEPNRKPVNKITWISPESKVLFSYIKAKPTPGEGNYGDGILKYFDSPYGRISSAICFDMDFPSLIAQVSRMDIDIMLVPGNDWQEISPYHTYVASIRGIEQGFNLVRAASRGLSASFNYKGERLGQMDYFKRKQDMLNRVFYTDIPTAGVKTIYAVLGDFFPFLCIAILLSLGIIYIRRK